MAGSILANIDPRTVVPNPNNPRRYFNEERLDLLRTSIQETGILVPLIVYRDDPGIDRYVLMDGERRWRSSLDLGLNSVPANVIAKPTRLVNLVRMFNIHNVREDWPLISVALSLKEVMSESGDNGEKKLSALTGLTRSTVRRAKRLLSIPDEELGYIQDEAHLERSRQVHREDLYLEIQAAESVLRKNLPGFARGFSHAEVVRAFARKAETGSLKAYTDFRYASKLAKAIDDELVPIEDAESAARELVLNDALSPRAAFELVAADGYLQRTLIRKSQLLREEISGLVNKNAAPSIRLQREMRALRSAIDVLLSERPS